MGYRITITDYITGDKGTTCIYGIKELSTDKTIYVGKAKDLHKRIASHWCGRNLEVERWMLENRGQYTYYIIELCTEEQLSEREYYYINSLETYKTGYNKIRKQSKEEIQKYQKQYNANKFKENPNYYKERNAKLDKEKQKQYMHDYYIKNKEHIIEQQKIYTKEHPEIRAAKYEKMKNDPERWAHKKQYNNEWAKKKRKKMIDL